MNAIAERTEAVPANVTDMGGGILAVIERAVRDPSVDIDKMERLLTMQERVMAEQAKRDFFAAFRAVKAEIRPVIRNRWNDQTKSGYADLEALANAIDPILEKHGFSTTFGTGKADLDGHYRVTCDLMHVGGHEKAYHADIPQDLTGIKGNQNKTATHGFGSTVAYGRRYLKLMIWDVATRDDDGNDASAIATVSADQVQQMRDLLEAKGKQEARFVNYVNDQCGYDVKALSDIRADDFAAVFDTLKRA